MKQTILLAIAAAALAFSSCQSKREQDIAQNTDQAKIDSLQRVIAQSNSETEDLARSIQQIREGFRLINDAEGRVTIDQPEGSDEQVIAENMKFIQQTLELNRKRIADLKQQLRNANQTSTEAKTAYEAMVEEFNHQLEAKGKEIEALRQQLAERDIRIAEQGEQITQLSNNVSELTTKNEETTRTVAAQDAKMHEVYYVFGTKKELREKNILSKEGVLRSSSIDYSYFTKKDSRALSRIPLGSKNVELKTSHPAGSYQLERDAQGSYTLRITDADTFWSTSKYLVVVVK